MSCFTTLRFGAISRWLRLLGASIAMILSAERAFPAADQARANGEQLPTVPAEIVYLNDSSLSKITGKGWTGIIYTCDPYCTFTSLVQEGLYSPSLTNQPIEKKVLKLVASTNPLYPLLIQEFPVLPHVKTLQSIKKAAEEKSQSQDMVNQIPPYARSNFSFGYSIEPGFGVFKGISKSSTQIQSAWTYDGLPKVYGADIHLMRGTALRLFSNYFQFVVSGSYWTTTEIKNKNTDKPGTYSFNQLRVMAIGLFPKYKLGLSYYQQNRSYNTEVSSLTYYPMSSSQSGVGFHAILKNGLRVNIYYPMQKKLKETEGFRVAPFKQDALNVNLKYCLDDINGFDVSFKSCAFIDYYLNKESAKISPQVSSGGDATRSEQIFLMGLQLRIGDELWR